MALFPNKPIKTIGTTPFISAGGTTTPNCAYGPWKYNGVRWGAGNYSVGLGSFGSRPFPLSVIKSSNAGVTWARVDQTNYPVALDANVGADVVFDEANGVLHFLSRTATANYCKFDMNGNSGVGVWGTPSSLAVNSVDSKMGLRINGDLLVVLNGGVNNGPLQYSVISGGVFGAAATLVAAGGAGVAFYPVGLLVGTNGVAHVFYQRAAASSAQLWYVTIDASNVIGTPVLAAVVPFAAGANGIPLAIGQGAIWNDRLEWAFIKSSGSGVNEVTLYEGTPVSAPVWTVKLVATLPFTNTSSSLQVFVVPTGNTQLQLFWVSNDAGSPKQLQYASYDGTTFGMPLVAWDALTNPCTGDPGGSDDLASFSVGTVDGDFEVLADEYCDSDFHTTLVWLGPPLLVFCNTPPAGTVGTAYTHTFTALNGAPPYTFSISAGFLPPGLSLDSSTGQVTGTPTLAGSYPFTVLITDSVGNTDQTNCSISIGDAALPPTISPSTLTMVPGTVPNTGTSGAGTSNTIQATAGSGGGGPITVILVSGTLPPGTTLAPDLTNNTGVISGFIPPNSGPDGDGTGTYTIFVVATDNNGTTTAMIVITVRKPAECNDNSVPTIDPELTVCECPANSTTILDIANWAAVGKLKRWDILPDAVEAAVDVYRGVCGKVPFDILRHISQEFRLTAGQAAYSLSCFEPSVLGIISVRLTYGTNKFRRMRRSDGRVYDSLGSLISSIPATYCRFGSTIEFNPMPSGASQTYRLRYWSSPPFNHLNVGNTILVTPPDWDELFKWETLYRMYIHLDMFEKAQALVNPVGMQRQQSPKRTIMFETAIIPRLWNDLLLTISQRENIDEDFSINPLIRNYTRT